MAFDHRTQISAGQNPNLLITSTAVGPKEALDVYLAGGVISFSGLLAEDHNYGAVGANTLRTASQIGNASGAADFNAGNTGAQTLRVVIATDQSAIPVSQSGSWTITANQGTSPWVISGTVSISGTVAVTQSTSPWVISSTQLPAALVGGRLDTNIGAWLGSTAPTVGQKTMANSVPVVIASNQSAIPVSQSGTWNIGTITTADIEYKLNTAARTTQAVISFSSSGDNTVVSATGGQTTKVHKIFFVVAGDTVITVKSAATGLTGAMTMLAGGSFVLDLDAEPWFVTGTNEAFIINSSNAVQVSGRIYYIKS